MSKALTILGETLSPILTIGIMSLIVVKTKMYPVVRLQQFINLLYQFILTVSIVYSIGWNVSGVADWKLFGVSLFSQLLMFIPAFVIALIPSKILTDPVFQSRQRYVQYGIQYASLLTSSLTQVTSYPYSTASPDAQKEVFIYESTSFLLLPLFKLFASLKDDGDFARADLVEPQETEQVQYNMAKPASARKKGLLCLATPLFISTIIGLVIFAAPIESKDGPLPYFLNQTFIYLQRVVIIMQMFAAGMALYGEAVDLSRKNLIFSAVTCLTLTATKQLLFPCVVKYLGAAAGVPGLVAPVFSAPCGITWAYLGYSGLAMHNAFGIVLMWATEWPW